MRQVTLEELKELAEWSRDDLWNAATEIGQEHPKLYLHWTAGNYYSLFDSYHINIDGDGNIYISTEDLSEVKKHTWKRNTGSIGITLCCGVGAGSSWLGYCPPTNEQIETMAQVIAVLCNALWLTINKQCVLTHSEAANNEDGYHSHEPYAWWNDSYGDGDTRGDLEYLGIENSMHYNPYATDGSRGGDVLRGKAEYYRALWVLSKVDL